jgi:hypothetical protein
MEKTKKALKVLLMTGNKVAESLKDDGKISLPEGMGIAMKAVSLVGVFKDLPEIKAEIKSASPEDYQSLIADFKSDFDIPNDDLEVKIEMGIDVLAQLALMFFKN